MVSCEESVRAVDDVVQECLERAAIDRPPVDPVCVVEALGLTAQLDAALGARGERRTINGRSMILIRPDERDERECFAVAHEIGEEMAAGWIIDRLDLTEPTERWREELANQFAGRLLCPIRWLREVVGNVGVDLRKLKEVFVTASHEVIARQLLSLDEPTIITIVDNARLHSRQGNVPCERRLSPLEEATWQDAHAAGRDIDRAESGLRVQAWAIHEAGWRREILRTTRLDE